MPSQQHDTLVDLFASDASLAPQLLRDVLKLKLPPYIEARIHGADLTEVQSTEYRADQVVVLVQEGPVLGIVVEVQLSRDEHKGYSWPVYATTLRARLKCPVCLLVVATEESVRRWATQSIELGAGNVFTPQVLHLAQVPVITDNARAVTAPELAVLSAVAHGRNEDIATAVRVALAAQSAIARLDGDRAKMYFDFFFSSLSEAARRALQTMDPAKYVYQSDFARQYVAQGRAEGMAQGLTQGITQGRAVLISKLLVRRFGPLDATALNRINSASVAELDAMGERIFTAQSLDEVLGH